MKKLIKKYFTSFTFFYRYTGNRLFIMIALSLGVSILDGFGLTMFLPLLQMVSGDGTVDAEKMGNLSFIVDGAKKLGISMTIGSVLMMMVFFFVSKGFAVYGNLLYTLILKQHFIKVVRLKLLNAMNRMSFKAFITSDAGQIQNTMTGEVDKIVGAFSTYFGAFQQLVMVIVYVGFAFFIDAQFAFLVVAGGILTNLLYKIIYTKTTEASRKLTKSTNRYTGLIIQHVTNFKYLSATGMVGTHSKKLIDTIYAIERSRKKIGILAGIGTAVREPILIIVVAAVIIVQVKFLGGAMGAMLISLLFFYRALVALMGMQQTWNTFLTATGSLENMQSFQEELFRSKEHSGDVNFKGLEQGLSIKDLSFSFGESRILKDINLNIRKNESVAFVGESGSGKTTLVNILAGLLPPDQGNLLIDSQEIKAFHKSSYQKKIGYITQEAVIFNDTIYNNVSFWAEKSPANLQRFNNAVNQAALSDFVDDLPAGLETSLGNNGINLSGGQKQRISIARELFKDIDILIMDEATSALDSGTERAIQDSIESLRGKYTLVIVAHRLATIRNVDKVVYMHKGRIEAEGSFEELVTKHPRFRKMVEMQEL